MCIFTLGSRLEQRLSGEDGQGTVEYVGLATGGK